MSKQKTIVWLRHDLRLADNPALHAACQAGDVLILYIHDEPSMRSLGAASKVWLHHALTNLEKSLQNKGGNLHLTSGQAKSVLTGLIAEYGITDVYWNRAYSPNEVARDKDLKTFLKEKNIGVKSFKANLLFEPWEVRTQTDGFYKVFTPFWKNATAKGEPDSPLPAPEKISAIASEGAELNILDLLPTQPNWATGFTQAADISEQGAHDRLDYFIQNGLAGYKDKRNNADEEHTSRLSPYLAFGQISPRQIWRKVRIAEQKNDLPEKDVTHFFSELGWREFSYSLLHYLPDLKEQPIQEAFAAYPWADDDKALKRWQQGQTGYPIVDAGMRELWATGFMHNRVRMIVASFLIKHLRLHWHHGERWFWDCLVDADVANNSASWQWVAGCGADAAPYFRIFNPITQGQKFDSSGDYVRKWVPELKNLPTSAIHEPWSAKKDVLNTAGVTLGLTYPHPMVDHFQARKEALAGYEKVKKTKERQ